MLLRIIALALPGLGIMSTMLPWVYYPKVDDALYGYHGDGVVTGFIFLLISIFSLFVFLKKRIHLVFWIITLFLGILNSVIYYTKIADFNEEKASHIVENPILAAATAGYELGSGVYLLGFCSIIFTALLPSLYMYFNKKKSESKLPISISLVIGLLVFTYITNPQFNYKSRITKVELTPVLAKEIRAMGTALINEDYSTFANYNHPTMVENYGGRKNLFDLLKANAEAFKEANIIIKNIELGEISEIVQDAGSIQVLLTQKITFITNGVEKEDLQKMIAISKDKGNSWSFININNNSKEELLKFLPQLNTSLQF